MWYQWLCEQKNDYIILSIFIEELISYYQDIRRISFLRKFVNLRKQYLVTKHNQQFQNMSLRVKNILDDNLLHIFMETLMENIQHEMCLLELRSLKNYFRLARKVESINMATRRTTINAYKEHNFLSPNPTQPTRLTYQQLYEWRAKDIFFNCDSKYSKGHKCGEKKLFHIDY